MKQIKKSLAIVLCLLMLASSFALSGFAAGETDLLLIGDSIAYGSGLKNSEEACYGKILADTCGFQYENLSVPGSTTNAWVKKLGDSAVIESVKKADIISMSIGGNDFLMENVIGLMFDAMVREDYSKFDKIAEKTYGNLRTIVGKLKEFNLDAEIILQTLYNPQYGNLRAPYQLAADRINEVIYRCSEEFGGLTVVDVGTALGDDRANFADDIVHPSVKGNEIIAEEMLKVFNEKGFTDKTELVIKAKGRDINIYFYGKIFEFFGNFFAILAKIF